MAGLMDNLLAILEEQLELYQNLLALAEEKRDAVISNDIESLQRITSVENTLISKNNRLEKKRITVTEDIANVLGVKAEELTLSALAEIMRDKPEHESICKIGEQLRTCIDNLKALNDENKALVKNALEYADYMLNVLRGVTAQDENMYNRRGRNNATDIDMIPTKPMFDQKQ